MRKLKCDGCMLNGTNGKGCDSKVTHRLIVINKMIAPVGSQIAFLLCDYHAEQNVSVFNYKLSKIKD